MTAPASRVPAHSLLPILLSCLGYFCYNISDASVKYLGDRYHFSQVVIFTFAVMLVLVSAVGYWQKGADAFRVRKKGLVCLRAALSVVVGALNVYVMPHLQLTTFYTLVFTSPLFVALMSSLILKEKLEKRQLVAIISGFAVILFVFKPGAGLFSVYAVLALLSSFVYAISAIVMRKIGPEENVTVIVNVGCVFTVVAMLPLMWGKYVMPTAADLVPFLLMGVMCAIAISCIAYSYQHAVSAASIAPYHYTQIVYGALIGYFFFNEVPSISVIIGAAVIVASGLFLLLAESRAAKKKSMLTSAESIAELPRN